MLEGEERPSYDFSTGRISLRSINVVNSHVVGLETARLTVTSQMETLVLSGLETLVSDHSDNRNPTIDSAPQGSFCSRLVVADGVQPSCAA